MYKIVYRIKALEEYEKSVEWYGQRSTRAAENFIVAVKEKLEIIKNHPTRNKKKYKNYYEASLKKYPFTIVYIIEESTIVIIAIYHHKRNPKKKYRK